MGMGGKVIPQPAGYSGTPLVQKLGIKKAFRIKLINAPDNYFKLVTGLPDGVVFDNDGFEDLDLIHFFTKQADEYYNILPLIKLQIKPNGIIWASWPKKVSKVITDITEEIIRNYAIETGLVDIKVCAIDEIWSGLKLVIPVVKRVMSR
jgi:hypothetical protein